MLRREQDRAAGRDDVSDEPQAPGPLSQVRLPAEGADGADEPRPRPQRAAAGHQARTRAAHRAPLLPARRDEEEGGARARAPHHQRALPRPGSLQGSGDRRRPRARRHAAAGARSRPRRLRRRAHARRERGARGHPVREVHGHRPRPEARRASRAVRGRRRGFRPRARRAACGAARVLALLAGLQHSGEVRLPGRLHDAEDAEGQAGGLRGPDTPRPRRLALTSLRALVLAGVVLAGATPAAAHSLLLASTPAANAQLTASPPYVVLRFNNRIEKRLSHVRLVDERGTVATAPTARAEDQTAESLVAAVPPLTTGVWRVEWQVFSTDGHVVTGSYQFRLAP
ncbi:MAG: hypothetical protein DMD84_02435 [Candidatus Rokuibacteriota bacterium]|nr:MAG: hypothetical protein DMD84_02435 [Candidatus Rokubacteria bacterium]